MNLTHPVLLVGHAVLTNLFFLAQTKMSWRSLLASQVTPWNQGSELSSATRIPQMTVVADLTRSEDELSLKPGDAVGDCHARRLPSVREAVLTNRLKQAKIK